MYTLEIKTENGKWLVNDKPFKELTYDERELLVKFILRAVKPLSL